MGRARDAHAERDIRNQLEAFAEEEAALFVSLTTWKSLPSGPHAPKYGAVLRASSTRGWYFEAQAAWPTGVAHALEQVAAAGMRSRDSERWRGHRIRFADKRSPSFAAALTTVNQLRAIVEDERILLACVGEPGAGDLAVRERTLLRALFSPLRRRLLLERGAAEARTEAALVATLEAVRDPIYVVDWSRQEVLGANAAARALLERERARVLGCVERRPVCSCHCSIVALGHGGSGSRFLVVQRPERVTFETRTAIAASRWRLTERQALVLALVAQGQSNKEIAGALKCAENTVEAHMTQLLSKAEVGQRGGLLARFWLEL
jgi:DNA-binding CsgD family transcriptional regulator